MSIMVQRGSLSVISGDGVCIWQQEISCPLSHLARLNAPTILTALRKEMPFTASSTETCEMLDDIDAVVVYLGDSYSANLKLQMYD